MQLHLKNHYFLISKQAILLMGAYARAEASVGNIEIARKVFDTTLASLSSQSKVRGYFYC